MYHEGIFLHYEGPLLAPDITRFLMMKMKSDIQSKLYEHKETWNERNKLLFDFLLARTGLFLCVSINGSPTISVFVRLMDSILNSEDRLFFFFIPDRPSQYYLIIRIFSVRTNVSSWSKQRGVPFNLSGVYNRLFRPKFSTEERRILRLSYS